MTRKRYAAEPSIAVLKEARAGISVQDLCRKHGISDATLYTWRAKYAGLEAGDVKKRRRLEEENRRLKPMVAEPALDLQALKALPAKNWYGPLAGRTRWAESTTGVPARGAGSKYLAVSESAPR